MTSEIAASRIARVLKVPHQEILDAIRHGDLAGHLHGPSGTVTESVARLAEWATQKHTECKTAN